ncbi:MAG: hypothetical protein PHW62_03895 [Candidatus Ratteibacteria bacterium]|nr:hypothetical protein [Candidatus Ratteibacteria bacterium]
MIFEINLLKDRVRLQKKKSFLRVIFYVEISFFVLTFIILGSYRLSLYYKVETTERKLAMLNEDVIFLSKEGATLANLRDINKKYEEITSQLSTINELTENRVLLSHKLKGLAAVIPDNVWIYKFNVAEEAAQAKDKKALERTKLIYLFGFVMGEREEAFMTIQSFIKDLGNEPLFSRDIKNLRLSSFSKPQSKTLENIMEFEITCQILKK